MEIWKDIPGYEGLYQASSLGQIRTVEGKITRSARFAVRRWKSRIMKGRGDKATTGRRVTLWKDGAKRDFLVARLVALTFFGEPPEKYTVNHKDGNRMNNCIENLEWLSLADNIRHGFETGLYKAQKSITVEKDGEKYSFRSYSQLDRFLGRREGYTSDKLLKNRPLIDKNGDEYKVVGGVINGGK